MINASKHVDSDGYIRLCITTKIHQSEVEMFDYIVDDMCYNLKVTLSDMKFGCIKVPSKQKLYRIIIK